MTLTVLHCRLMYWAEVTSGQNGAIRSGNLSGIGFSAKIVSGDVWDPVSLYVDYMMGGRLFWVDRRKCTIESANYDGSDRYVLKGSCF